MSHGDFNACSVPRPVRQLSGSEGGTCLSAMLSSSEKAAVKEALAPLCPGQCLKYASGAGYKLLCVILGLADVYVLSEGSTFKWDSCAPHALLRALGGGVVELGTPPPGGDLGQVEVQRGAELTYHKPNAGRRGADQWANQGGLVAYLDPKVLLKVLDALTGKI